MCPPSTTNCTPVAFYALQGFGGLASICLPHPSSISTFLSAAAPLACFKMLLLIVFIELVIWGGRAVLLSVGVVRGREVKHKEMSGRELFFFVTSKNYFSLLALGRYTIWVGSGGTRCVICSWEHTWLRYGKHGPFSNSLVERSEKEARRSRTTGPGKWTYKSRRWTAAQSTLSMGFQTSFELSSMLERPVAMEEFLVSRQMRRGNMLHSALSSSWW